MQSKYDLLPENGQEAQNASQELTQLLEEFLSPLLLALDRLLDKRLVRTLVQVCVVIIRFRNQKQGLLLSELGSYMDGYQGLSAKPLQEPRGLVICFDPSNGVFCRLMTICSKRRIKR